MTYPFFFYLSTQTGLDLHLRHFLAGRNNLSIHSEFLCHSQKFLFIVKLSAKYFSDLLVSNLAASTSITIFVKMLKFSQEIFSFSKQQIFCEGKIENLLEYFRIFNSFDMGFSKLIKLFHSRVGAVSLSF